MAFVRHSTALENTSTFWAKINACQGLNETCCRWQQRSRRVGSRFDIGQLPLVVPGRRHPSGAGVPDVQPRKSACAQSECLLFNGRNHAPVRFNTCRTKRTARYAREMSSPFRLPGDDGWVEVRRAHRGHPVGSFENVRLFQPVVRRPSCFPPIRPVRGDTESSVHRNCRPVRHSSVYKSTLNYRTLLSDWATSDRAITSGAWAKSLFA